MRKDQQYPYSQESSQERVSIKRIAKKPRVCKVSDKLKLKIQKIFARYRNSNAFSTQQINSLKLHMYTAAHRTQDQLQTELTLNKLETLDCAHKWELIARVAHGRTFGKIIKKCPTCRAGSLVLELDEGRYICQFDGYSNSALALIKHETLAHGIPTLNCGLAFDFSEIQHINWINYCNNNGNGNLNDVQ